MNDPRDRLVDAAAEAGSGAAADPDLLGRAIDDWIARGYMTGNLIDPDRLVETVDAILRRGASSVIPSVTLTPRASAAPNSKEH